MHHIVDFADDYNEVPDADHVQQVMKGFMDTVTGSEGMNLTSAQHYIQGVMFAADVDPVASRSGNEGFFSAIGTGIKKMWDYIVKMFDSIWNFLTGKGNKEEEAKVKEVIADATTSVNAMVSPAVTPDNVQSVVKQVAAQVEKLPDSPEKKKLEAKVAEVKAELKGTEPAPAASSSAPAKDDKKDSGSKPAPAPAASKPTQAEVIKAIPQVVELVKEAFELSVINAKALKTNGERIESSVKRLEERKEEFTKQSTDTSYSESTRKSYVEAAKDIGDLMVVFEKFDHDTSKIKDIASAKHYLENAKRCVDATTTTLDTVKRTSDHVKAKMSELNGKIRANKDEEKDKTLNDDLFELSCTLNACTTIITFTKAIRGAVGNIAYALGDQCPELKEKKK